MKSGLPSVAQAKKIASVWASYSPIVDVMTRGLDGAAPFVDPTTAALVKRGWLAPDGNRKFNEYGRQYLPHRLTGKAMLALELFLRDMRIKLPDVS